MTRASVLLALLVSSSAQGQKDVSLETLARAMEGRLGVYACNLQSGEQIALNADKRYEVGAIRATLDAGPAAESASSRPETESPRALAGLMKERHLAWPRDLDHPLRKALVCGADPAMTGLGLSPVIEVGGATTGLPRAPGIAGYAATRAGDLVFCVMTSGLDSSFSAPAFFPEILEALVRRLLPAFEEPPFDPKPPGMILASIHERAQDPKLFPAAPEAAVADLRRGLQRLTFGPGEAPRVAVLGRPLRATRVTVQWWSPAQRAEARSVGVLDARKVGEVLFDHPAARPGCWRVRVAFGDAVVLDEKFFVTAK